MYLTKRSHHAVTVMLDVMLHSQNETFVRLSDIAQRHPISVSYLELLFTFLVKASLVKGERGPRGGYKLGRSPNEIPVAEIIRTVDRQMNLEQCANDDCQHSLCISNALWASLGAEIESYLSNVTLADLAIKKV